MDRIVVVVPGKAADEKLTALLKLLFPECKIVTVSPDKENVGAGQTTADSEFDETEKENVDH